MALSITGVGLLSTIGRQAPALPARRRTTARDRRKPGPDRVARTAAGRLGALHGTGIFPKSRC